VVYEKLREPDFYKTEGVIKYTPRAEDGIGTDEKNINPKVRGTKALLPEAKWIPQTFNNCGPATTSMVLQYFGHDVNQAVTKEKLRTNPDDKNVFTYEIAKYLRTDFGIESKLFYGGNPEIIKNLVANGFYVVLEDWLHPNEDIGHVTIIRGFDDEQGVFIADDSYIGVNITYRYDEFTKTQWKPFNYEFLPVYKPGNEELLKVIVGDLWEENSMFETAADMARDEILTNNSDMYAWFNLGTSLFGLEKYSEAKTAFEKSRELGWPRRMLWYQIQPVKNYNSLNEYQKAIELADIALWSNESFAEAHLEKGFAYKGLGNLEKAREETEKAIYYAPNLQIARDFLLSL